MAAPAGPVACLGGAVATRCAPLAARPRTPGTVTRSIFPTRRSSTPGPATIIRPSPVAAAVVVCAFDPLKEFAQSLAKDRVPAATAVATAALLRHGCKRCRAAAAVVRRQPSTRRVKRDERPGRLPEAPCATVPRLLAASRRGVPRGPATKVAGPWQARRRRRCERLGTRRRQAAAPPRREARRRGGRAARSEAPHRATAGSGSGGGAPGASAPRRTRRKARRGRRAASKIPRHTRRGTRAPSKYPALLVAKNSPRWAGERPRLPRVSGR